MLGLFIEAAAEGVMLVSEPMNFISGPREVSVFANTGGPQLFLVGSGELFLLMSCPRSREGTPSIFHYFMPLSLPGLDFCLFSLALSLFFKHPIGLSQLCNTYTDLTHRRGHIREQDQRSHQEERRGCLWSGQSTGAYSSSCAMWLWP